jgi:hypothetical protein
MLSRQGQRAHGVSFVDSAISAVNTHLCLVVWIHLYSVDTDGLGFALKFHF